MYLHHGTLERLLDRLYRDVQAGGFTSDQYLLISEIINVCRTLTPGLRSSFSWKVDPKVVIEEKGRIHETVDVVTIRLPWAIDIQDDGHHVIVKARNVPPDGMYFRYHASRHDMRHHTAVMIDHMINLWSQQQ